VKIRSITAPNPGPLTLDGTRTYILGDAAVIDPGPADDAHIRAIAEAVPHLQTILITHRHADHAPAAGPLKKMFAAHVLAPDDVLDDCIVDVRLHDGQILSVADTTIEVIATPGHTSEHVCFLTADGDLFTGDTILGKGTTAIFPPDGDMADYIQSLHRLRARSPKRIHPAHGPTRDDAIALIDEYIAHRLQREGQVLEALRAGATTLPEMRARIYESLDPNLHTAAEIQLAAHLIKLAAERRIRQKNGGYSVAEED
jgi:glyoxylase-like metal-dependent hydrolase (beta-lactamase superfamily II)